MGPIRNDPPSLLAALRASLTAVLEAADRSDDSFGAIGEFFAECLDRYLELPWQQCEIRSSDYYLDFLELATWEDYGYMPEGLGCFFDNVEPEDVEIVEMLLGDIREELIDNDLDYQADEALTLLGDLHIAKGNVDRFPEIAERMGSRQWTRIVRLAEAAADAGRADLAFEVFTAADEPGRHRDYLRDRCAAMLGRAPGRRRPRLRLIHGGMAKGGAEDR
jgi:hypothetical protein